MSKTSKILLSAIAAVVVVTAGVAYWVIFPAEERRNRGPGGSLGEIFVDSPEIYTRERLVNDRFREDAWLKEMLELLSKEEAALQGFIRTSVKDSISAGIGGGTGPAAASEESGGDPAAAPAEASPPADTDASREPEARTILRDRFQRYLDIRDAVRKQIVENQLDDRHDLSANTLYAFKFDVTVLPPGNDTSAWAKVTITVSDSERETRFATASARERMFYRWVGHLETTINEAYLEQQTSFGELTEESRQALLGLVVADSFKYRRLGELGDIDDDATVESRLQRVIDALRSRSDRVVDPLNWLIAQWVIHDQITRRDLEKYVEADARTPVGSPGRIALRPRTAKAPEVETGFEFEALVFEEAVTDGFRSQRDGSYAATDRFADLLDPEVVAASGLETTDGLIEFKKQFLPRQQSVFTYSVSPKVSVESVGEAGTYIAMRELTSKLQASNEAASVNAAVDLARQLDSSIGAIRRNALIVGFSDARRALDNQTEAMFGWYIGPRFQLSEDGRGYQFRHVPDQHALSALIALPVGWPEVKVTVTTEWIREDGSRAIVNAARQASQADPRAGQAPDDRTGSSDAYTYHVELPIDPDKITAALSINSPTSQSLEPIVYERQLRDDTLALRVGEPGAILIPGRNLWRSTVVTVGSQLSDRITVLPNMEGIVAHFDKVLPAPGDNGAGSECPKQIIRVWTSTGLYMLDSKAQLCGASPARQDNGVPISVGTR